MNKTNELEQFRDCIFDAIYSGTSMIGIISKTISGLLKIKKENALAAKFLYLARYYKLLLETQEESTELSDWVSSTKNGLKEKLSLSLPENVKIQIQFRLKSWKSLVQKAIRNYYEGLPMNLYDLLAFRVIIDGNLAEDALESLCYTISDVCIEYFKDCDRVRWRQSVGDDPFLKDYIAFPKNDWYKSLHLSFEMDDGKIFEVQVRTMNMHVKAEGFFTSKDEIPAECPEDYGHNAYKRNKYGEYDIFSDLDLERINLPHFRVVYTQKGERIVLDEVGLFNN